MENGAPLDKRNEDLFYELHSIGPMIVIPRVILIDTIAEGKFLPDNFLEEKKSHFFLVRW